jgi:opacity protein-like surface antigen
MNRILTSVTTLAFVAIFAMPAQAQVQGSSRLLLQGGITSANLSGDDVASGSTSSKTGFLAGVGFNYFFAENWSLSLEGNWLAGLGAKEANGDGETKLSYFSFPVGINFAFPLGENEKTWLGLQSGITANLRLTCNFNDGGPSSQDESCKEDSESVSIAVPLGAGIGFKAADAAVVFLTARYQLGLSSVDKTDDVKINWWEFIVGVGFAP